MSKKIIIGILVVAFLISGYFLFQISGHKAGGLESPGLGQVFGQRVAPKSELSSSPSPTPKTFQFDSTTDLKSELESINSQILDSDFH